MATDVRIYVTVPAGAASFTGKQPVTFGVPFAEGVLTEGHGAMVVDGSGKQVAADISWTAKWRPPDYLGAKSVKWLLIDFVVDIAAGVAAVYFLRFGDGVTSSTILAPPPVEALASGDVTVNTGTISVSIGPAAGTLGVFKLTESLAGVPTVLTMDAPEHVVVERSGGVRTVLRVDSHYTNGGTQHAASTRFRFYASLSMVRIYHTMTWNRDASRKIAGLKFDRDVGAGMSAVYGFTQSGGYDTTGKTTGKQVDALHALWNDTDTVAGQLDGYAIATGAGTTTFLGMQDTWQQYPAGFGFTGTTLTALMMGPPTATPIDLSMTALAAPPVIARQPDPFTPNVEYGGFGFGWECSLPRGGEAGSPDPTYISPRGFAKTYTMTLWLGDNGVSAAVKNALTQQPVTAYIDPTFACLADVASPMRAKVADQFAAHDVALQRVFEFTTKTTQTDASRDADGMFGWLNWGNMPWQFFGDRYVTYRFLAGLGKGTAVAFWLMYLRSGDPAILRWAMANARCITDICICHVPEEGQFLDDPDIAADRKGMGIQGSYSEIPFSYYSWATQNTEIWDGEGYLLAYYVTGDERLRDAARDRLKGIEMCRWGVPVTGGLAFFWPQDSSIGGTAGRELYSVLGELCRFLAAFWDDTDLRVQAFLGTLATWAANTLSTVLFAQDEMVRQHGVPWFPGITSPFYLGQALIVASRVLDSAAALDAADRWEAYVGSPTRPGYQGQSYGPSSLWVLVEQLRRFPSQALADEIGSYVRGRVELVLQTGTFSGRTYTGMGPYYDNDVGVWIRELLACEWANTTLLPETAGTTERPPVPYVSSQLQVGMGVVRHVVFIYKPTAAELVATIHWNAYNIGVDPISISIKVWRPDATYAASTFPFLATFYHTWGNDGGPLTLSGPAGVYAIDYSHPGVGSRNMPANVTLNGAGQVSHFVQLGISTTSNQANSIQAVGFAGQIWMRPEAHSTVRVQIYESRTGRTQLLDEAGVQLAVSQIDHLSGTTPVYAELNYAAGASPGRIRLLIGEPTPNRLSQFAGIRPYLAPTKNDLFDPFALNPTLVAALALPNT